MYGFVFFGLIALAVTATYAVNTVKIRMVAHARPLAASSLEALQGLLYVVVLVRLIDTTMQATGVAAYVVGAFLGTLAAMIHQRRRQPVVSDHHHACCPIPGTPLSSVNPAGTYSPSVRQ
jgi:uncharacterized protein YebE (UPF0316 family)